MIIDRSHIPWAAGAVLLTGAAGVRYAVYAAASPSGPSGRTTEGLAYGVVGFLMILFAALLAARRQVPHWRLGSGQFWLKAHVWISLVAMPMVLFHAGFRIGGPLATVLMAVFGVVYLSGIFGLGVQQIIPELMILRCPMETIYDQIDAVLAELGTQARQIVQDAVGELAGDGRAGRDEAVAAAAAGSQPASRPMLLEGSAPLVDVYLHQIKPYLEGKEVTRLATARSRKAHLEQLRMSVNPELYEVIDRLDGICEERRQLAEQKRLHHWLHWWLCVHVPLSYLLVVLMCVHAIQAIRY